MPEETKEVLSSPARSHTDIYQSLTVIRWMLGAMLTVVTGLVVAGFFVMRIVGSNTTAIAVISGNRFTSSDALVMEARIRADYAVRMIELERQLNNHLREEH